jgi:hypothetical protein
MALRSISLILVIALVSFGCTTNKDSLSYAIDMRAEAVQEGILLTFTNIPPETTRLSIIIMDKNGFYYPEFHSRNYTAVAEIIENNLDEVKRTNKVLFAFAQTGHSYDLSARFSYVYVDEKGELVNLDVRPNWARTECIAVSGIYFNNNIYLELNENQKCVTLSSEPEFSSEFLFEQQNYNFDLCLHRVISENGNWGATYGDKNNADGLHWFFENEVTTSIDLFNNHLNQSVIINNPAN